MTKIAIVNGQDTSFLARLESLMREESTGIVHIDYARVEEHVLANYINTNLGEPYRPAAYKEAPMEALAGIPNHVSIDKDSPHYWPHYRNIGVRINGEIRKGDVHEFNVSEGWAHVRVRNGIGQYKIDPDNTQQFLTERIEGTIEPYLKKPLPEPEPFRVSDQAAIDAAEAKRRRKAEKLKAQTNGR